MGKIVITTNISLDGVVEDPDGQEGFAVWWAGSASSGARTSKAGPRSRLTKRWRAEALLLGRLSDEWFATRWLSRSGEWAEKLNSMPKFVVSSAGTGAKWSNAALVIEGDVVGEVSKLKKKIHGEILVYASYQLVHTLMEHDLVDELRLVIFPVVLGAGERLFGATSEKKALRLVDVTTIGDGLTFVTYQVVRGADRGRVVKDECWSVGRLEPRPGRTALFGLRMHSCLHSGTHGEDRLRRAPARRVRRR